MNQEAFNALIAKWWEELSGPPYEDRQHFSATLADTKQQVNNRAANSNGRIAFNNRERQQIADIMAQWVGSRLNARARAAAGPDMGTPTPVQTFLAGSREELNDLIARRARGENVQAQINVHPLAIADREAGTQRAQTLPRNQLVDQIINVYRGIEGFDFNDEQFRQWLSQADDAALQQMLTDLQAGDTSAIERASELPMAPGVEGEEENDTPLTPEDRQEVDRIARENNIDWNVALTWLARDRGTSVSDLLQMGMDFYAASQAGGREQTQDELERRERELSERTAQIESRAAEAEAIATRDRRVAAGEDIAAAQHAAASEAREQLGGAAGRGAAAQVGAQAGIRAGIQETPQALQRHMQRQDMYRQQQLGLEEAADTARGARGYAATTRIGAQQEFLDRARQNIEARTLSRQAGRAADREAEARRQASAAGLRPGTAQYNSFVQHFIRTGSAPSSGGTGTNTQAFTQPGQAENAAENAGAETGTAQGGGREDVPPTADGASIDSTMLSRMDGNRLFMSAADWERWFNSLEPDARTIARRIYNSVVAGDTTELNRLGGWRAVIPMARANSFPR
jgi:hypothetical protein